MTDNCEYCLNLNTCRYFYDGRGDVGCGFYDSFRENQVFGKEELRGILKDFAYSSYINDEILCEDVDKVLNKYFGDEK